MVERKKWILYKHTSNFELVKAVALDVKNSCKTDISVKERYRMQERLAALNLYRARNPKEKPLDAINHRINTLEYWMFGYEQKVDGEKRFMFSPLGNLFLKHINDESKISKIFLTMMFAIQFQHPASGTDKSFQLYPFRLIMKLLTDKSLDFKLYNFEVEYLAAFVEQISPSSYEDLVNSMLIMRGMNTDEISKLFRRDEHAFVNTVHEWEYYTQRLLSSAGILNRHEGELICKLYHPTKTNSKSGPTPRFATRGYVSLKSDIKGFAEKLLNQYSYVQQPLPLDDSERLTIDVIKEIYNFYPETLLHEIGEINDLFQSKLLELPKLIEKYSNNHENGEAYLFENVLVDGFNMFWNVEANGIGGAGHTDIECLYITKKRKFAVDAKSTSKKLPSINAGRLREHREEIGGEYTIVVTPRYVPAVLKDIKGTPIVIIRASTFSEYLYNHIFNDIREIDYEDFDSVIINNLGKDISRIISDKTLEKFAACS
jgi:type II restriction enzyme